MQVKVHNNFGENTTTKNTAYFRFVWQKTDRTRQEIQKGTNESHLIS